jgi:hypothetical protein
MKVGAERTNSAGAHLITGLSIRTLQEKASAGLIPGARKTFGRWTFDVAALRRLGTEPQRKISLRESGASGRVVRSVPDAIQEAYERQFSRPKKGGGDRKVSKPGR